MNRTVRIAVTAFVVASAVALGACAQTKSSESTGAYVDDSAITSKVKVAILQDPALKVFEIHVNTAKNVVQLSGFVDTPQMVGHAGMVASQVSGVAAVRNDLMVK